MKRLEATINAVVEAVITILDAIFYPDEARHRERSRLDHAAGAHRRGRDGHGR